MLQQHSFSHGISALKSNTTIHRSSSLFKLNPFLDTDGVLRVGDRFKRSMLDINKVHPVILPKANLITKAIVTWYHENVAHCGRSMTLITLEIMVFGLVPIRLCEEQSLNGYFS